jgi:hypothetical protein
LNEYDEIDEPNKSGEYLELIEGSERYYNNWQARADNIDKIFSDSEYLSRMKVDREFNLFWSNIQTMSPQIYARPPIPVVTPKFKDRRPVYRTASEFLERNCIVSFDIDDIDATMRMLRDDLSIVGRGCAWVRYVKDDGDDCTHYEHVFRRDFTHDPARCWKDVAWVARRGWLTRKEMKKRFGEKFANEADYQSAPSNNKETYTVATDYREKCGVWEMWHKPTKKVVWVSDGIEDVLDMQDPYLDIKGFFPCPEPVYSTVQRGTLIPVPDVVYYKDQLEEINDLTRRIHTLGRSLQVKGFYQSGGDIGAAVDAAINMQDDAKVMIPVSSTAGLSAGSEAIVWLPIQAVSETLMAAVELRRQLIDDVYQTIGMADIQRGATESDETYGAQRIKQQNGSVRLRDKQNALVRIGRDLVRIGAQVIIDNYSEDTMIESAQMDMPTDADVKKNVKELETQAKEQIKHLGEQAEEAAQQAMMQAQQTGEQPDPQMIAQAEQEFNAKQQELIDMWGRKIKEASEVVTIDQVMDLLRDERIMPFVLDIETDSTIYPDEQMEKASRIEFMNAFQSAMGVVANASTMGPEAVALAGGVFKFALAPYRVGRELEGLIDDLVDQAPQIAERMQQAQGGGEQAGLIEAQNKLAEAEMAKAQAQTMKVQSDAQLKQAELQGKMQDMQIKYEKDAADVQLEQGKLQLQQSKQEQEFTAKMADMDAKQNLMQAQTAKILAEIGLDVRKQDLEEYKAANEAEQRTVDTALRVESENRANRSQEFNENQALTQREVE